MTLRQFTEQWWIRPRRPHTPRTKIFSISCSFSENLVTLYVGDPHWRVGAPPMEILDPPLLSPGIWMMLCQSDIILPKNIKTDQ